MLDEDADRFIDRDLPDRVGRDRATGDGLGAPDDVDGVDEQVLAFGNGWHRSWDREPPARVWRAAPGR